MSLVSRLGATLVKSTATSLRRTSTFVIQESKMAASLKRNYSDSAQYETLRVSQPSQYVVEVQMNRPDKSNAMNRIFWREIKQCFEELRYDSDCRVVLLTGAGKNFSAGLDIMDFAQLLVGESTSGDNEDTARKAITLIKMIKSMQQSFTALEECLKPVIAVIQGACVGGGVDMVSACDVRICSKDAYFQIKEVDLGLMADVGTIQRLPKLVGNASLLREFVYTARKFSADEASGIGMVSGVHESLDCAKSAAKNLAQVIASKSPVAVQGSKKNLLYSTDHSVEDALDYAAIWNSSMLQTEDLLKAVQATMQKEQPIFSKL